MRAQRGEHIVDGESGARSASASTRVTNARSCGGDGPARSCFGRRRGDERADAAPRLEDAGALELGVDARDGVGVDAELDRQLADGGQLIAGVQPAGGNGGAQAAIELGVDRRRDPGRRWKREPLAVIILVH